MIIAKIVIFFALIPVALWALNLLLLLAIAALDSIAKALS